MHRIVVQIPLLPLKGEISDQQGMLIKSVRIMVSWNSG